MKHFLAGRLFLLCITVLCIATATLAWKFSNAAAILPPHLQKDSIPERTMVNMKEDHWTVQESERWDEINEDMKNSIEEFAEGIASDPEDVERIRKEVVDAIMNINAEALKKETAEEMQQGEDFDDINGIVRDAIQNSLREIREEFEGDGITMEEENSCGQSDADAANEEQDEMENESDDNVYIIYSRPTGQ